MKIVHTLALITGLILSLCTAAKDCDAQVTVTESAIFVETTPFYYDVEVYHDQDNNDIIVDYLRDEGWPNFQVLVSRERIPYRPNFHWIVVIGGAGGESINVRSEFFSILIGAGGDDALSADCPLSLIYGLEGNDAISTTSNGVAVAWGGDGDDLLAGNGGFLFGQEGNDCLVGAEGDDYLDGGPGRDFIMAGFGANQIYAGEGTDMVWVDGASSIDMGPPETERVLLAQPPDFYPIDHWRNCHLALMIIDEWLEQLGLPGEVFPEGYWKQG